MPANIMVGAQWGDEGKGRIADWLSAESDVVARYAGGDNAGHTVNVTGDTFQLRLVPTGILHDNVVCLLGGGMVINPARLVAELDELARRGIDVSPQRVLIADSAHIITPVHIALDQAREAELGAAALGTTQRGIGPAYTDKAARIGLRAGQMRLSSSLENALAEATASGNELLASHYNQSQVDLIATTETYLAYAERLTPHIVDTGRVLRDIFDNQQTLLCEGTQGTLLDLDHGSYPYVTSSSTSAGGALTGLGFGPAHVKRIIGVAKSYCTRAGAGPFPTELTNATADRLRGSGDDPWDEYSNTTGNPRRCGWLDAVALRYAGWVNGLTELALTKLDILSGFDEINIAIAYQYADERIDHMPLDSNRLGRCQPIYETLPGWSEDITTVHQYRDLPRQAQQFIERIEYLLDIPISIISVGPERNQTIIR